MAITSHRRDRFILPTRIRSKKTIATGIPVRLVLIDRIADLQGIETVERRDDTLPRQVDVYLKCDCADRGQKSQPPTLLCSLNCNGVLVGGLDPWAKHQVVSHGWGKLILNQVLIFLPRDNTELEVVWKIFRRAYENLFTPLAAEPGRQIVSTWDWPKFSRPTLQ